MFAPTAQINVQRKRTHAAVPAGGAKVLLRSLPKSLLPWLSNDLCACSVLGHTTVLETLVFVK